jgi:hypothetical protein
MPRTFAQLSDDILQTRWAARIPGFTVTAPEWHEIRQHATDRFLDLACVLKFKKSYSELIAMGDPGLLQLAKLFPDCLAQPQFLERYREAQTSREDQFLRKLVDSIQTESRIDKRILDTTAGPNLFLFMNWEIPIWNPELGCGLASLTNRQVFNLLDEGTRNSPKLNYDEFVNKWNIERMKQELRKLCLRRPAEVLERAHGPYFFSSMISL